MAIEFRYVLNDDQLVDMLTNPLRESRFKLLCTRLGLRDDRLAQGGV